jgi:NCAIR mutase (PurE)-related protein
MSHPEALRSLLESVAKGEIGPDTALGRLKDLSYEPLEDFAKIDHHRQLRTGFPEVIWGPGKTTEQIVAILKAMRERSDLVMATRIDPEIAAGLQEQVPDLVYYPIARICAIAAPRRESERPGTISILTAGTADIPVAEEAAVTASLCGFTVRRLWDVGVAGIHRLLSHRHLLEVADVIVVVAGMEGALPGWSPG